MAAAAFADRPSSAAGLIDVNSCYGPIAGPADSLTLESLQIEHAKHGVACGLTRSLSAAAHDPITANAELVELCKDHSGLVPVAIVGPTRSEPIARQVAHAHELDVAAFWLEDRVSISTPSLATSELVRSIGRTGRPLFVPVRAWGDATRIGKLTCGLGIPVILVGVHYDHIADDLSALDRYPHLHLETSALAHLGAIEAAVRIVGPQRLLLGTGSPQRAASSPINAVAAAAISEADREQVLSGNARRLFGLDAPPLVPPAPPHVEGAIDVHTHISPSPFGGPRMEPGEMLQELRSLGVVTAAASALQAIMADLESGNAATARACAELDGLLGYVVVDPRDLSTSEQQLRRYGGARGMVGVKIHCQYSRTATASQQMAELFRLLARHGKPVKIHNDGEGWAEALQSLASQHKRLPIIVAHAGPGAPDARAGRIAGQTDNLFVELASSFADLRAIRDVVRLAGRGKTLFGTDMPLLNPAYVLGSYQDAEIDAANWTDVVRSQARALFRL